MMLFLSTTQSLNLNSFTISSSSSLFVILSYCLAIIASSLVSAQGNCWKDLSNSGKHEFKLACTIDGNFKPIQCEENTKYCFCVDEMTGKYTGSLTQMNQVVDCNIKKAEQHKVNSYRRRKPKESPKNRGSRGDRCNASQRFSQIEFLIGSFRINMTNDLKDSLNSDKSQPPQTSPARPQTVLGLRRPDPPSITPTTPASGGFQRFPLGIQPRRLKRSSTNQQRSESILEWKFERLDVNYDRKISQEELLPLVEFSRKSMPMLAGCANSFMVFCDANKDSYISRSELFYCFNPSNTVQLQNGLKQSRRKNPETFAVPVQVPPQVEQPEQPAPISSSSSSNRVGWSGWPSILKNSTENVGKNLTRLDCLITRSNLLESVKHSSERGGSDIPAYLIPKCTTDGYYEPVQCSVDMHFCWCVSKITGETIKPILPSMTQDPNFSCDNIARVCTQKRRFKFHQNFRALLGQSSLSCESVFDQIDSLTRDQSIDKHEWKAFKKEWKYRIPKQMRKCINTEMPYCDLNGDKSMSRDEWVNCCNNNVRRKEDGSDVPHRAKHGSKRGRRPSSYQFNNNSNSAGNSKVAEVYLEKRNRPRQGKNPLSILT